MLSLAPVFLGTSGMSVPLPETIIWKPITILILVYPDPGSQPAVQTDPIWKSHHDLKIYTASK